MADVATILAVIIETVVVGVTGLSGYFMYRQATTSNTAARNLIVTVHIFFLGVILFEVFRTVIPSQFSLRLYVSFGTIFILLCVQLLTVLAWAIYLPVHKTGVRNLLSTIYADKIHSAIFTAGTVFIGFVAVYLVAESPYTFITNPILSNQFSQLFLGLLFGVLILFMTYPT